MSAEFRLLTRPGEISKALGAYLDRASSPAQKVAILRAGAIVIRNAARKPPTPISEKMHYAYLKNNRVTIHPGNLRKSMAVFRTRDNDVVIGPRVIQKNIGQEFGRTVATASGYYASFIYGSASAFRKQIMESALSGNQNAAFEAITRKYAEVHKIAVR